MAAIPAEAFCEFTRITDTAVSPTGERIAFCTREYDLDADETVDSLWVVPADGAAAPLRLTRASDGNSPSWSPDGSKLAFLAARERDPELRVGRDDDRPADPAGGPAADADDGDGATDDAEDAEADAADTDGDADEPKPQVWVFDVARGGDARQVTDRDEGVSAFDWSPDGGRLVVAARDPTDEESAYLAQRREDGPIEIERLQHKFDGAGYLDEVTTYLFVVDVETRTERRLDAANDGGFSYRGMEPAWGPTGRIAFLANHTDRPDDNDVRDVYTVAPDGSDSRRLTDGEFIAGSPTWSHEGALAFTGQPPDNWYVPAELYVVDPGTGEYRSVSGSLDRTLAWGGAPEWLGDGRLVGLLADEGWTRLARFDPGGDPERVFETQDRMESLGHLSVGGGTVAVSASRPAEGTDLFAFEVDDLDATTADPRRRLTALNETPLETHPTPACERISFESTDETTVEALVYHPPGFDPDDPDPRGLVLDIHGGPMAYDEPRFRFKHAFLVSRGYLVATVNYRGSTSYGRAFCEVLKGAWGTVEVDDLQAGVDELLERGWADPDRLFPTGFSQGGVNTAYLVAADDRWAAAAAEHGVYDLRSDFGTGDSHNWYEADFGLPWEVPDTYDDHSPITDVGDVSTPLLVTAGEEDWRCPASQAEQLYVAVRKQGVDAKLVVYPGEHHNVGDPERAVHRLEELDAWFGRYDPDRAVETADGER